MTKVSEDYNEYVSNTGMQPHCNACQDYTCENVGMGDDACPAFSLGKNRKRIIKNLVVQVNPHTWRIPVHTQKGVDTVKEMIRTLTNGNCGFFVEESVEYE